jgi:hypothetical protein
MRLVNLRSLLALLAISNLIPAGASSLVAVGSLNTPAFPNDVEVVGDLAYVTGSFCGFGTCEGSLCIVDVSNPAAPVKIGALDWPGYAGDVELVGDLAYVADGRSGLRMIDVSDPAVPVGLGSFDTPGSAVDVEVVDDLAYVVGVVGGYPEPIEGWLRVIDVSDPALPVELGALVDLGAPPDRPDLPFDVEVVGNIAYVVGATWEVSPSFARSIGGWLRAIDVSNPASPVTLAALAMPVAAYGITVVEDFAYVAAGGAGLRAIDVSDLTSPVERGILDVGVASDVEVAGNFAYVADANSGSGTPSGLRVIDVSEPRFPAELGALGTPGIWRELDVVGDLAYVVGVVEDFPWWSDGWLRVIDVSDPTLPVELSVFETPGIPNDVEVAGGIAYVAESSGLLVVDVSDPALPVALGAFETPGAALDLF